MNNSTFLTVSELNKYIKRVFDNDMFLNDVFLKGEISNLKIHSGRHLYFSLKDENSKINAVMFNYKLPFVPKDGMSVQIKGRVNVYEVGGTYQVYVQTMEEDGIGNLYVLFEELKQKLAKEGLFDEAHKKRLPRLPKRVGVITADTGAAIRDIITTINRRYPLCEVILFPTLVQGANAKENIVEMIKCANNEKVDVIILGRGGGSIEDLWAFNEEIVARAIFDSVVPIVSAVGHEIDFTISDFVADLRAATPTAAAELVVPNKLEINRYLSEYKSRLYTVIQNKIKLLKENVNKYSTSYVLKNPNSIIDIKTQKFDNLVLELSHLMENNVKNYSNKLERIKTKLELLNPTNILSKGYSIVKSNGKIIKTSDMVEKESDIEVILGKGKIIGKVSEVIND